MTYTIIARCPRTGRFGIGTTTFSIACGRRNESLRANVGICKSQAFYRREVDPLALNLLAQGYAPHRIAHFLAAEDADFDYRQFGIIDRDSNVFVHTGSRIGQWAGHRCGPDYAAYGNGLAGPQTVDGIVRGFLEDPDAPLEQRLLRGIECGHAAGGQATDGVFRPERSAWIRVVGRLDHPEIDLRLDLHDRTRARMRELFERWRRDEPAFLARCHGPQSAGAVPMIFSVVARCPRTGQRGIGIASDSLAIGMVLDGAMRASSGIGLTQGLPNLRNNRLASSLLAEGFSSTHALNELLANDDAPQYRQIALVDRAGGFAVHSGECLPAWTGQLHGADHLVSGCHLPGNAILDSMRTRFGREPSMELDERLLQALEAGSATLEKTVPARAAPVRSAAIVVWGSRDFSELDLRVDWDERDAVAELRAIFETFKPFKVYYDERARNPREALPQLEFAQRLCSGVEKE